MKKIKNKFPARVTTKIKNCLLGEKDKILE